MNCIKINSGSIRVHNIISRYFECTENDEWECFNFTYACKWLKHLIDYILIDYGQCDKDIFINRNLKIIFPSLTDEEIENCNENENRIYVVDEDENKDYLLEDLLPAYKKLETMRFIILKREYGDDPDLLILNRLSACLQIFSEMEEMLSQTGEIKLIEDVINAKYPGGSVFDYIHREEVIEN